MSQQDILSSMIRQPGQHQAGRAAPELDVHFAEVDDRDTAERLAFVQHLATLVRYYRTDGSSSTWAPFFQWTADNVGALIDATDGKVRPDIALMLAFFEVFKEPLGVLNGITERHLEFYYREVLRLGEKAAVPDLAHVVLELKKGVSPVLIGPGNVLNAGKDPTGVEQLYTPTGETVINAAKLASVRAVYVDRSGHGVVRAAPVANSGDGLGGALPAEDPSWYGFGTASLPAAELGFAIASPTLRLAEGTRTITVEIGLSGAGALTATQLDGAFSAFLSGEKSWLGPFTIKSTLSDEIWSLSISLDTDAGAVVDYDAAVHGYSLSAKAPVLQIQLKADGTSFGYTDLARVTVKTARVRVEVKDIAPSSLENDHGKLDPKKAFLPFGPAPVLGERLLVGCAEALGKRLTELTLALTWKGAPSSLASHYAGYLPASDIPSSNTDFKARVRFQDVGGWSETGATSVSLFESGSATSTHPITLTRGGKVVDVEVLDTRKVSALGGANTRWAAAEVQRMVLMSPVLTPWLTPAAAPIDGVVTLELKKSFLHELYRESFTRAMLKLAQNPDDTTITIPKEPYTPTLQSLRISYKAQSNFVPIDTNSLDDYANEDLQFFHLGCFGQTREHGYQRNLYKDILPSTDVPLLPSYPDAGELLLGLSGIKGGDSVSLLFQVAEGSADPELDRVAVRWSVLNDNYWQALKSSEIALDTTNDLLASGLVRLVLPTAATTTNTAMPTGMLWVRAAIDPDVAAVCRLIEVAPNAIEARFTDQGNDPAHLDSALAAGSIAKFKTAVSAVKAVKQPYASFNGAPTEQPDAFHTRVSERLRHKNRAITAWDYERIVLEAFPRVHRAKCIPHAKDGVWMAPGHILLVLVPDLRNRNAIDRLQPKVDADTIDRVTEHVAARCGMGVAVHVKNPTYQRVRLDFKVKLRAGYDYNFYRGELEQAIIDTLAPWASDEGSDLSFGGRIYRSVLLDFVEELAYVDYVTDFKMYTFLEGSSDHTDVSSAEASRPDAILVSDYHHDIAEIV